MIIWIQIGYFSLFTSLQKIPLPNKKELPVEMMLHSIGFSNLENGFQPMQKAAECILSQFNFLYTTTEDFRESFQALKEIG